MTRRCICDRRRRLAFLRPQTSTQRRSTPCLHRESRDQILPAASSYVLGQMKCPWCCSCRFSFPSERFALGLHGFDPITQIVGTLPSSKGLPIDPPKNGGNRA